MKLLMAGVEISPMVESIATDAQKTVEARRIKMMQQEPPTFKELQRPRPWSIRHTNAGYSIVDSTGVTVAINLSLSDATRIAVSAEDDWEHSHD